VGFPASRRGPPVQEPGLPSAGQSQAAPVINDRARILLFLAAFYGLAIVWGIRNIWQDTPFLIDFLFPFYLSMTLCWWAISDSKRCGRPIALLARQWFLLAALLLVPGYVVWTRRWRGLGLVILHTVCWYGLCSVVAIAGYVTLFGWPV
jgi:hypothetical protein